MELEKITIVFAEMDGKPISHHPVEKSEAKRILKLLEVIPSLKEWTPIKIIARKIGGKRISTTQTIRVLAGVRAIFQGDKKIAEYPILLTIKGEYNPRNNLTKTRYLRPPIYVKNSTMLTTGGTQ